MPKCPLYFPNMECKLLPLSNQGRQAGMSLAEMVITTGLFAFLLAALISVYVFCGKAFVTLENHLDMNSHSRYALDRMSREIRKADAITSYTTNQITILVNGTNVTY